MPCDSRPPGPGKPATTQAFPAFDAKVMATRVIVVAHFAVRTERICASTHFALSERRGVIARVFDVCISSSTSTRGYLSVWTAARWRGVVTRRLGRLVAPSVSPSASSAPEVTWLADYAGALEVRNVAAHAPAVVRHARSGLQGRDNHCRPTATVVDVCSP